MSTALEGIRVIEWAVLQQGPVAASLLGDMGAEIIKIEPRITGEAGRGFQTLYGGMPVGLPQERNFYFENCNRNKKSLTLDVTKPAGRDILYRLIDKADVFITNFRAAATKRAGLDYQTLSERNPRLIYAAGSSFGPKGPEADLPATDFMGQARSGWMHQIGEEGMPPILAYGGIIDQLSAFMLSYGVMAALVARNHLGVGQEVNASLLGSAIAMQGMNVGAAAMLGKPFPRHNRTKTFSAITNYYRCSDDKWIMLGMYSDQHWHQLCPALGLDEFENDPRFDSMANRGTKGELLCTMLSDVFAKKTQDEWLKIFKEFDVLGAPIKTISDLTDDPQMLANNYLIDYDHPALGKVKLLGFPVGMSKTPQAVQSEAPELGQHTEVILADVLGYSWDDINKLKDQEVI